MKTTIKILIAEHDPADLELIHRELNKDGLCYEAETIKTEACYINALENFRPHIILCDYTFPSFDGNTAFEIKSKLAPAVPFILVSGTGNEEKAVELIKHGATDYVLKDRLMSLPIKIKRALNEAKEQQEKSDTSAILQIALSDLKKIMDSTLDVICTINRAGDFVTVNAASERNWGYKPNELMGKPFINFVFEEDVEKTIHQDKNIVDGMPVTIFENRYVHKNGSLVPMLWSAKWDNENELIYCVAKNATEKKGLEQALNDERQRFYDLFAQAPSCIGILRGPNHVFEMANPLYLQLIGKKDIIGKSVKEVLPEVSNQGFINILDEVYTTGQPFFASERLVQLDLKGNGKLEDRYVDIAYQAHKSTSGITEGIFFFTNDVTEQVVSRKKIEESEKKYRQIVELAQEGIWLIDENNDTTLVNKKMCEIIGFEQQELMQEKIHHFMDDESRKNSVKQIERRKQGFSEIHNACFINKNGKPILLNISTNPVFDEAGAYKGALAMVTDITKRKKAEADLIKRERQLTLAAEMAKLGYWEYDVLNDLFEFNDQFYAIFKTTAEKVGGYTMSSARYAELFVHADDRELVGRSVANAIRSADSTFSFKAEHRIVYGNGETGFISVQFYIVKDEQGRTVKNFGVNQDITESKQIAERIIESNQRYKYVTRATSDAIWDWDLISGAIYWGEGFQHIFGYHYDEITNDISSWTNHIHPDDIDRVVKGVHHFIDGTHTNWEEEYRYLKKDNTYAYVKDKGIVIRDQQHKAVRMVGAMQDISKQKQEEQWLKLLESVITNSNDVVIITDAEPVDGPGPKIVFVNEAFTKTTGYTAAEVTGKFPRFLQGPKSDRQELAKLQQALKKSEPCTITVMNYKKDGEEFWNNLSVSPVADEKGRFTHWVSVQRDVTAAKQHEIVLNEMNRNLEQQSKELALSNAELEQFAYVASHDLQEPLRMVISFLVLLEKKYKDVVDEKGKQYISFAVDGAKRMKQLITDILEFSRVGRIENDIEPVDTAQIVEDVKLVFRKQVRECSASFQIDPLPVIQAYRSSVTQIFQNLIVNALKYHDQNIPVAIKISAAELEDHWQFSVADNGIGIKEEYFSKIFSMFQRLHSNTKYSGTGMGLAITKKEIVNMGGDIWLTSQPGKGSTFYFTIAKKQPVS